MTGLRKRYLLVAVLLASQVLISITSGLVLALSPRENIIFPGVFIGGIDVGGLSREQAVKLLDDIVNEKMDKGRVIIKYWDQQWSFKPMQLGIGYNIPATVDKALVAGRKGTLINESIAMLQTRYSNLHMPFVLDVKEASLQSVISGISSKISRQAKDAVVIYNGGSVVLEPEEAGIEVQLAPSISRVKEAMGQLNEAPVDLVVRLIPPRLTRNDFKGIKDSLGIGLAAFSRSKGETPDNVRLLLDGLDGQMVNPGEIFSFNKAVGARITEQGYHTPIITQGRLDMAADTGASRAASALYQAVIYSGLEVIERHAHFAAPGYIGLGQDAAVTSGEFDLKFENNTQTPVYIKANIMGNRIAVNILGTKTPGRTVQVITQTSSGKEGSDIQDVKVQRIYYHLGIESNRESLSEDRYE